MAKNPAVLWNVDQTGDVIGAEGRTTAQGNVGLGNDFVKSSKTSKKYVTHVSRKSDGTLQVNVEQPSLSDFNATTANCSIGTNSSGVIEAQDLSGVISSAETTTGTTYVSSITQSTNGQVSYKTQTITEATDEANSAKKGITTLTSDLYASNTRTTGHTTAVTPDGVWVAIDSAINSLDATDSAVTNQFITSVSESDGIISVTRAQPSIGNLVASSNTNYSIGTNSSTGKIEAQNLTVSTATDGGDSDDLTFVSSVTQESNGKISVTTKHVPYSIQLIDSSYTYEQVLELIADGKYPVVRYQNGYDTLYLPMFTAPASSGTYIEFRGFAKSSEDTIYKIVCAPETGFGELTSTTFVSISDASNFIDNFTYDSATASNQPGSVTLKYHKYNSDYTSILTLKGDLDSGIFIRDVTPAETPAAYKIVNQRPIPTYTTNYKDRILSVNSAGDGLEWRSLANADWNATSGAAQILNKPDFIMKNQIGGNKNITGITLDNSGHISSSTKQGAIEIRQEGNNTYSLFGFVVPKDGQLGRYLSCDADGIPEWAKLELGDYTIFDSEYEGDVVDLYSISAGMYNNGNEFVQFTYADGSSTTTSQEKFLVPTPLSNRQLITDANGTMQWGTPDPVCSITVSDYFEDPDELTFGNNANHRTITAHIDTDNVTLGCLVPPTTSDDDGLYLKATYVNNTPVLTWAASGSGNGDVVGPDSANNNHIPLYDGTTGKLIKNSKFYFTDEAQDDKAEAAKQVKTKAYNDPFRTSQQIVRASQGSGHQDGDFAYWYAINKYRRVAFGISSYGNIKITEFVQSGSDSVSPSSEQDIITSSGTGNSTTYQFNGRATSATNDGSGNNIANFYKSLDDTNSFTTTQHITTTSPNAQRALFITTGSRSVFFGITADNNINCYDMSGKTDSPSSTQCIFHGMVNSTTNEIYYEFCGTAQQWDGYSLSIGSIGPTGQKVISFV